MDMPLDPEYPYYIAEEDLVDLVGQIGRSGYADWDTFLGYAEPMRLAPEQTLIRQGDGDPVVYVLSEGRLAVRIGGGGGEKEIATVEPLAILGEQTFLDDGPRTATVVAVEESTVHRLTRNAFERLCNEEPSIGFAFLFDLARSLSLRARKMLA